MKFFSLFIIFLGSISNILAQNRDIANVLNRLNSNKIPYIYPGELELGKETIILDAREWEEYKVSKIPGAIYVGFNSFDIRKIKTIIPSNDNKIVIYCSIGVRSERIAEKIIKAGYKNVFNLWGGIFEWKNEGKVVVDQNGRSTEKVHAYSQKWGIYLKNGIKVYE
ncbi:MAG: rhodanese-like domain-containing protein [Daejeonella sp.]|uniref:rhodanese-like domain-containing protein n=1 Tax=Daejeonella sp. TaxID=2805397 RepID=UPI003C77E1E3